MAYKLRKAPKRSLYWVVNKETGKKHSKEPISLEKARSQMKALYAIESGYKLKGGDAGQDFADTAREALGQVNKVVPGLGTVLQTTGDVLTGLFTDKDAIAAEEARKAADEASKQKIAEQYQSAGQAAESGDKDAWEKYALGASPSDNVSQSQLRTAMIGFGKRKTKKWIQEAVKEMKTGAFTKQSLRHDETPLEFAEEVVKHPENYIERTRKRAQFLLNISKRKLKGKGLEEDRKSMEDIRKHLGELNDQMNAIMDKAIGGDYTQEDNELYLQLSKEFREYDNKFRQLEQRVRAFLKAGPENPVSPVEVGTVGSEPKRVIPSERPKTPKGTFGDPDMIGEGKSEMEKMVGHLKILEKDANALRQWLRTHSHETAHYGDYLRDLSATNKMIEKVTGILDKLELDVGHERKPKMDVHRPSALSQRVVAEPIGRPPSPERATTHYKKRGPTPMKRRGLGRVETQEAKVRNIAQLLGQLDDWDSMTKKERTSLLLDVNKIMGELDVDEYDDLHRLWSKAVASTSERVPLLKELKARVDGLVDEYRMTGRGAMPSQPILHQIATASYKVNPPQSIDRLKLISYTPTLKFYEAPDRTIVVGIRGTEPSDKDDILADGRISVGELEGSTRYQKDLSDLKQFQITHSPSVYDFYGVGHSLGGAILDMFLKDGLLKSGVSYNPAVQSGDFERSIPNKRIYNEEDPLYQLMGKHTKGVEVRKARKKNWFEKVVEKVPYAGKAFNYYKAHKLSNFVGGGKTSDEVKKLADEAIGRVPEREAEIRELERRILDRIKKVGSIKGKKAETALTGLLTLASTASIPFAPMVGIPLAIATGSVTGSLADDLGTMKSKKRGLVEEFEHKSRELAPKGQPHRPKHSKVKSLMPPVSEVKIEEEKPKEKMAFEPMMVRKGKGKKKVASSRILRKKE